MRSSVRYKIINLDRSDMDFKYLRKPLSQLTPTDCDQLRFDVAELRKIIHAYLQGRGSKDDADWAAMNMQKLYSMCENITYVGRQKLRLVSKNWFRPETTAK